MEYTTLGETGVAVSQICPGCMSFGSGREWMLDREESEDLIERAIGSERVLGEGVAVVTV